MRIFFIGFGQAGGKIVDMFLEQDKKLGRDSFRGIAVNTARTDLMGLKHIDLKDRILIGQTVVKGHGVGTDNAAGAKITMDEADTIISAVDRRGTHDVDAFMKLLVIGNVTMTQHAQSVECESWAIHVLNHPPQSGSRSTPRCLSPTPRFYTSPTAWQDLWKMNAAWKSSHWAASGKDEN